MLHLSLHKDRKSQAAMFPEVSSLNFSMSKPVCPNLAALGCTFADCNVKRNFHMEHMMIDLHDHINSAKRTGHIDFSIEERRADCVISRMSVTSGVLNPYGTVQAGAMIWLADVTASVLALEGHTLEENGKGFPLAIDIHTNLIGNQRDGEIFAEARFVSKGKTVLVIRTRVTGNKDKLLAEVTTTHLIAK